MGIVRATSGIGWVQVGVEGSEARGGGESALGRVSPVRAQSSEDRVRRSTGHVSSTKKVPTITSDASWDSKGCHCL